MRTTCYRCGLLLPPPEENKGWENYCSRQCFKRTQKQRAEQHFDPAASRALETSLRLERSVSGRHFLDRVRSF